MKTIRTALFLTPFLAFAVQAHNIWLEPSSNTEYVMKFGHIETITYPESKFKSVQYLQPNGELLNADYQFKNGEVYLQPKQAEIVYLKFDNGIWSKLPSGKYVEKTKQQEPTAEFSVNPIKLGKAIFGWSAQTYQAHNQEYELVPLAKAEAGKPLDILVLHNGKPVKDIKVGLGEDAPFNLTNEQGIAQFTPTKGFNKIWAEFEQASDMPDVKSRSFEYMLTFDVK